jgi:hypothetical protein
MNELTRVSGQGLGDTNVYYGEVISVEDKSRNGIIKVRISNIDGNVADADLPPCYPIFNQAFFRVVPKIGERVYVQLARKYNSDRTVNQEKRYWTAVSISQPQNIDFDPYHYTASSHESDGWVKTETPITEIPEARGTYADQDDVAIYGRNNVDILLKNSQLLLRTGRHESNKPTTYNRRDPAYVQLKHGNQNPARQTKKRTSVKVVPIDPTHTFNIIIANDVSVMIKTIQINGSKLLETFTQGYDSRELAVAGIRAELDRLKSTYPKWKISTSVLEFANDPKVFPNNRQLVRETIEEEVDVQEDQGSVVNVVGDRINLLSHQTNDFNLTDPVDTITTEQQQQINSESHPLVKGDRLLDFISLVKNFVAGHVHGYHGVEPAKDPTVQKILNYDLNQLINENIRMK